MKKQMTLLTIILALSLILAACGGAAPTADTAAIDAANAASADSMPCR